MVESIVTQPQSGWSILDWFNGLSYLYKDLGKFLNRFIQSKSKVTRENLLDFSKSFATSEKPECYSQVSQWFQRKETESILNLAHKEKYGDSVNG